MILKFATNDKENKIKNVEELYTILNDNILKQHKAEILTLDELIITNPNFEMLKDFRNFIDKTF
ncbi:MAG: hypothetical protein KBT03_10365 [Bacteroidales bacterium]|nr:hypothetical protein [Candidatus Scybalousia scybalohippi]